MKEYSRRDFLKTSAGAVGTGFVLSLGGAQNLFAESQKKRLAINIPQDPMGLDAAHGFDAASLVVNHHLYDGLLRFDQDMEILPNVAEDWKMVDNVTYLFYLNKNVRFHSGKPVKSDDVVYSFNYVLDKNNKSIKRGNYDAIDLVEKVDDYTVRITLKEPFSPFLMFLASAGRGVKIVDKDLRKRTGKTTTNINSDPTGAGTGPFKFVEWVSSDHILMKKNEDYHLEGLPKVDEVFWKIIRVESTAVANFAGRTLDILHRPSFATYDALIKNPDVVGLSVPSLEAEMIYVHCGKPPFNDVNLRAALNYAVDREELIQKVFRGHGVAMEGPWVPGDYFWNPACKGRVRYDPDKARWHLKKAGKPDGFEFELWCTASSWFPAQAEIVQEQLSKVGIKAKVVPVEKGAAFDKVFAGNYQAHLEDAVARIPHPDNMFYRWFHPKGQLYSLISRWSNPELTSLLDEARRTFDREKQRELYFKAQLIIQDHHPLTFLLYHDASVAVWKWVKGYKPTPVMTPFLREVDIKT